MRTVVGSTIGAVAYIHAAAAQSPAPSPAGTSTLTTVLVSALVSLLGLGVSIFLAHLTARHTARSEYAKRQNELALKISETVSSPDLSVRRAAMRRFAIGVVKIVKPEKDPETGKVFFIPMNSRVTVGREDDNDIVLNDARNYASRWHCGFIADQNNVWLEDYIAKNPTLLSGAAIEQPSLLKDGDIISIGPYELRFKKIKENSILSQ